MDLIVARTFTHESVLELAEHSTVSVINGLSDLEHPCQTLGDFLTIFERKVKLKGLKLALISDGNVCNSLLLGAAIPGVNIAVACPNGYKPNEGVWRKARKLASKSTALEM